MTTASVPTGLIAILRGLTRCRACHRLPWPPAPAPSSQPGRQAACPLSLEEVTHEDFPAYHLRRPAALALPQDRH
jgi:hypothetical protein